MFESIVSLGRKLVGRPAPAAEAGPTTADDSQRIWVRAPFAAPSAARAGFPGHEARFPVRVRNIFRNGIHLVAGRGFPAGALLQIELPGTANRPPDALLATVIHVSPEEGEWALDCVFASELGDEELRLFGAQRVKPSAPDRRTWVRFPCNTTATFAPASSEEANRPAQVLDVSANGVGLLVDRPVEAGALLSVRLSGPAGGGSCEILACVVRVSAEPDRRWHLGCSFIRELSEAELRDLM